MGISGKANLNLPTGGSPVCEAGTRQKARGTMRGYRWGKFQGWATFAIGLITWAPAIWSFPGLVEWIIEIAVGSTMMLLGIGLIQKRRFALVLLYAQLPIFILAFVFLKLPSFEVAFAVCWYFIPAIFYYPKRWKEFSRSPATPVEFSSHPKVDETHSSAPKQTQPGHSPAFARKPEFITPKQTRISDNATIADHSEADALFKLGQRYYHGQGVPQDFSEAASCYRKSAELGSSKAQLNLGALYENGEGVSKDRKEACFWMALSYAYDKQQFDLSGMGLSPKDLSELRVRASKWFAEH
jgi:hypothetical protein